MGAKSLYVVVGLVGMLLLSITSTTSIEKTAVAGANPGDYHEPIFILSDSDFTPENGVIGGSGTKNDPYIIANWIIKANGTTPYMGTTGIFIANTTKYFVIRNVTIFGGDRGILLDNVSNFVIEDSKFYNINSYAIVAGGVTDESLAFNGTIRNNEAWDVDSFVWATGSNFIIEDNYAHDLEVKIGTWSIGIGVAANNSIVRNNDIHDINVTNGENEEKHYAHGIFIGWANNVSVYNNTIINMTIPDWGVHGIATSYAVNVKIYNNTVKNIDDNGISLFEGSKNILVNNNLIENCRIRNILVYRALDSNITIRENVLRNANDIAGIGIEHSSNITVMDNEIYGSKNRGIHLLNSTAIRITNSDTHNNLQGIRIEDSSKVVLDNNSIHLNSLGVAILNSENVTMKSNRLEDNEHNLGIWAYTDISGYLHNIDPSNTINGKPVYYLVGADNINVPSDAGFVGIINSRNITAKNLQLEHDGRILIVNSTKVFVGDSSLRNSGFPVDIVLSSDVIFKNVVLNVTENSAVSVFSSSNITITNITIVNVGWDGVYLNNVVNSTVSNSEIYNCTNGMNVHYSNNNIILNNTIHHNRDRGISLWDFSGNNLIKGNDVYSNTNFGISLDAGNNVVEGNYVHDNSGDGIISANSNRNVIIENVIWNNYAGIRFWNSNYTVITANRVYSNRENGIVSDKSFNCTIEKNKVYENKDIGIGFWRSGNFSIVGNTVHENGFAGIVSGHGSNGTLKDNTVFLNNASGIEVWEGSHVRIINATVYDNFHAGIWAIDRETFAWIENSTVYDNSWRGIEFHYGGYGVVVSSRIFNNSIDGIYIANTANVTIIGSDISNNGAGGLAADYSSDIRIVRSKFQGNNGTGIKLVSVHDFTVTGSIIEGKVNSPPIAVENSDNGSIYLNNIHIGESVIYTKNSSVSWNSPDPIIYVYEEHIFSNYLGNYWDNYIGADSDKDGIGDVLYQINQDNVDEHPLIGPIEGYDLTEVLPLFLGTYTQAITNSGKVFFVFNNLGTPDAYSTSQYISRTVPVYVRTKTWSREEINFSKIEDGDVIISVGGPLVNPITAAYDNIAQVHMNIQGREIVITAPQGNVTWVAPRPWWNVTEGYFVIQAFYDEKHNVSVFTIYGTDADSTAAGAYYFMAQIYPNIDSYGSINYIVGKWADTEPGADIPLPGADQGDTSGFSAEDSIEILFQG